LSDSRVVIWHLQPLNPFDSILRGEHIEYLDYFTYKSQILLVFCEIKVAYEDATSCDVCCL